MRKEGEDRLTIEEVKKLLSRVMMSNEYDKLKTLYQYVQGDWISQNDFCIILEDEFGLVI